MIRLIILSLLIQQPVAEQLSGADVIRKVIESTKKIKTLSFTYYGKERYKGEYYVHKAWFKKQVSPLCIYYKQISPDEGVEVLVNADYRKKVLVNPNAFPWSNLTLDPQGSLMRAQQHHSIFESGFEYFSGILGHLLVKYKDSLDKKIAAPAEIILNNKKCYKIELNNPYFKFIKHTLQGYETPLTLARNLRICEYHIIERNTWISDYQTLLKSGKVIVVPNDYAKKMILYISKDDFLPVKMEIYDDKGLFEYYEFSGIVINPVFSTDEFSPANTKYNFD